MSSLAMLICLGAFAFADDKDFVSLDKNKDGVWSRGECDGSADALQRFLSADHDGDWRVTTAEFAQKDATNKNVAWQAFQRLDVNKDNVIDKAEYTPPKADKAAQAATESEFARFDRDENGKLDIAELVATSKSGLSTELRFRWLDANEDGRLELGELLPIYGPKYRQYARVEFWAVNRVGEKDISLELFKKREAKPARTYQEEFWVRDANDDDALQLSEFAVWDFGALPPATKQLFLVFDANADGKLAIKEFAAVPGVRPDNERIVPDPIRDARDKFLTALTEELSKADADKDRQWTAKEWPGTKLLVPIVGDAAAVAFAVWDFDGDGNVTAAELERGVNMTYGMVDPLEGRWLWRFPNGTVFDGLHWQVLDKNGDHHLSLEEFLVAHGQKPDEGNKRFQEFDKDHDGQLSPVEVFSSRWLAADIPDEFLRFDTDRDGRLSPAELSANDHSWRKQIDAYIFPQFDLDDDSQLSLHEFCQSPLGDRTLIWWGTLTDANADGRVVFSEFLSLRTAHGPLWMLRQARWVFDRIDKNHDGHLELGEFPFQINLAVASAETLFQLRDKNADGQIDFQELTAGEPAERLPAMKQLLAVFDTNSDQSLSLTEFRALPGYVRPELRMVPDPLRDESNKFLAALNEVLSKTDANQDRQWTAKEWPGAKVLVPIVGDAAAVAFAVWDFDGDGNLTAAELERGAGMAYGMVDPIEGRFPWRHPDGVVFDGIYWPQLDTDRDRHLSRDEFRGAHARTPEENEKRFQVIDKDEDGKVSPAEIFSGRWIVSDPVGEFLGFDTDRDGRLSPAELSAKNHVWRKSLDDYIFPQFDLDEDGQLSLREFLQSPLGDRTLPWWAKLSDANADGRVEFSEYLPARTAHGPLWMLRQTRFVFDRLDRNHNGQIELSEFPIQINLAVASAETLFQFRDKNADGQIDLQELTAGEPAERLPALKQLLAVFDSDGDRSLTLTEFRALPSYVRPELRVVPDPWQVDRDRFLTALQKLLTDADKNTDGEWSAAEWPQPKGLAPLLAGAAAEFKAWDFDRNGQVTAKELQRGADTASGLVDPYEGRWPWRLPDGRIFDAIYWQGVDGDRDGRLTKEEFLSRSSPNRENNAKRFAEVDADQDGVLTPAETFPSNLFRSDPPGAFLSLDSNRDGHLDADELAKITESWRQPASLHLLPAFDLDGDGRLSYREYRHTPLGNLVHPWRTPSDLNGNGQLEFEEFFSDRTHYGPLWLYALSKSFFDQLDANHDGTLQFSEYSFRFNVATATAELLFQARDKNGDGKIDWSELSANEAAERHPALKQLLAVFDADFDQTLTLAEFRAMPGYVRPELRTVPDPIRDERDKFLASLQEALKKTDSNQDRQWSTEEWPDAGSLIPIIGDASAVKFSVWDFDGNSSVSEAEIQRGADFAYGLIDPIEGRWPWRFTDGVIFDSLYWRVLDKNQDSQLSREEFLVAHAAKPDEGNKRFREIDKDQDGTLSPAEFFSGRWLISNLTSEFLQFDSDRDGRVSQAELSANMQSWRKGLDKSLLPQFDLDEDGQLSLREFLQSPLGDRIIVWHEALLDTNADGQVTFSEFISKWTAKRPLWMLRQLRFVFDRLDRNHDGHIDPSEFPIQINLAVASAETIFKIRDKNGDGKIDWEELIAGQPADRHPALKQMVAVFDIDQDEEFTLAEFVSLPGYVRPELRVVPDPLLAERDRFLATLQKLLASSDKNNDGEWSAAEWPQPKGLAPLLAGAAAEFKSWDFDRNGQVAAKELQRGADTAFGVVDPYEGRWPWRLPDGRIFDAIYWQGVDGDRDGRLTKEEFLSRYSPKNPESSAKRFAEVDADQDGVLTPAETIPSNLFRSDPPGAFLNLDSNRDGHLNADELAKIAESWRQPASLHLLPAFDLDGDGQLSFREYRHTPLGNLVHPWRTPSDLNGNGQLEFDELFADRTHYGPLWLYALTKSFFDHLDANHDRTLMVAEYDFKVDIAHLQPEVAFQFRDKNKDGGLTLEELFSEPKPDPTITAAVMAYQTRKMRAEESFLAADKNGDHRLSTEEHVQYAKHLVAPEEYRTKGRFEAPRAVPKAGRKWDWDELLAYGFTGVNLMLAVTAGAYWIRKRKKPA